MELPAPVHVFPLTFDQGGHEVTVYPAGIETALGLLLLDVGPVETLDQLRDGLAGAGFAPADVALVLLTHHDWDHAAELAEFQASADAVALASATEAPAVDGRADTRADGERYPPARVDIEFDDGLDFRTDAGPARVIPTPGHTPAHVSVHLPEERFLFAADALTADADGLQGPSEPFTESMETARSSGARLADLDIGTTHCFHGGTVAAGSGRIAAIAAGED
jgi:glyoxylase-like metal-dependent hydrolase (beta-lactamase superfamily II)